MAPGSRVAAQFFGTDLDVYHFVARLLRNQPDERLNFFIVYDHIQRSNLPLKRKPKSILERSIERVLEACCPPEEVPEPILETTVSDVPPDPNIMNRIIVQSRLSAAKAAVEASADPDAPSPHKRTRIRQTVEPLARKKSKSSSTEIAPSELRGAMPLEDLQGLDDVKRQFRSNFVLPLKAHTYLQSFGMSHTNGVLLSGPPGCGKTAFCRSFAAAMKVPFFEILGPSVVSNMSGESEKMIREVFEQAKLSAPSILFIDEIDSIAVKRESSQTQMDKRIVAQLLLSMDSLDPAQNEGKPVVVLAATNLPETLDPALRRGGRFGMEISFPAPDEKARSRILQALTRKFAISPDVDFDVLGRMTSGYVGADIAELVNRVLGSSLEKYTDHLEQTLLQDVMDDFRPELTADERFCYMMGNSILADLPSLPPIEIGMADFYPILKTMQPSLKRDGFITVPSVTWDQASYPPELKKQMMMAVVNRIKFPDRYTELGLSLSSGVLLWGPPGCGKTLLAKVVANDADASLISVNASELLNKYVGESERAVRQLFARARAAAPCIVFFDEIDALAPRRTETPDSASRVVNTLLAEMDGMMSREGVHVIATTNRPDAVDPALLRPGRFNDLIYMDLPDFQLRLNILEILLRGSEVSDTFKSALATESNGFSGADLTQLVATAKTAQLEYEPGTSPSMEDRLRDAKSQTKASVVNMKLYRDLQRKLSKGSSLAAATSIKAAPSGEDGTVFAGSVMADTTVAED